MRLVEPILPQQGGEDGAHLLESERDLAALFVSGIRDDGEVG